MEETAVAIVRYARSGTHTPDGAWEKLVPGSKEASYGPWRPYLEILGQRFNQDIVGIDDLLEKVDSVYDSRALVFSNNFITTVGGTQNAVAVWRYLASAVKRIDLLVEGIQVRYLPPANVSLPSGEGGGVLPPGGRLELDIASVQHWVLPTLLLLVRKVFGDVLCVRVTSTLVIDPASGRVVAQTDHVHNWLRLPLLLRLLLGLTVPLALALYKPY